MQYLDTDAYYSNYMHCYVFMVFSKTTVYTEKNMDVFR